MLTLMLFMLALRSEVLLAPVHKDTCTDNELLGIELAGNTYRCSKLLETTDWIGIYKNREQICAGKKVGVQQHCCATCQCVKEKARESVDKTNGDSVTKPFCKDTCTDEEPYGINMADNLYPCSRLLSTSDSLGIYKNREQICAGKMAAFIQLDCCATCQRVISKTRVTTTQATVTVNETTVISVTETRRTDECVDNDLHMADGGYTCRTLLDPTDSFGIYKDRVGICNGTNKMVIKDCCKTCKTVMKQEKARIDGGYIVVTDKGYVIPED